MTATPEFTLDTAFLSEYENRPVPWGFGDLSYVTYKRTYARQIPGEDRTEEWWETCQRVIEGMFTVQKKHCRERGLPWDEEKAANFAKKAYDRLFHFKWTPPGRGLWMMGTDFIHERTGAPLNNCGYVSTKSIGDVGRFADPFGWMFEMSMLGVGVGFDTKGIGQRTIEKPKTLKGDIHSIGDSREGWRQALERLLNAYVGEADIPEVWDFDEIRPKGAPIKSFGGEASGPAPLKKAIETLTALYDSYIGKEVDAQLIVDTMNIAGRCVVAGGVRRTAQISFGDRDNEQFLDLKLDKEKVGEYRWASNNSVMAEVGMDYSEVAKRTGKNGEPGYLWLDNARAFGRMKDEANWDDEHAEGSNPCVTADTRIPTSEGWRKIGDMVERDDFMVYQDVRTPKGFVVDGDSFCGEHHGVVSRGVKKVVEVTLDTGQVLRCTPNHKLVTTDGKVAAEDLDADHEVLISTFMMEHGKDVDPAWAEVMGFMVGDGHVHGDGEVRMSFFGEKRQMMDHYRDLMKSIRREFVLDRDYSLDGSTVEDRNEGRLKSRCIRIPDDLKDEKLQVPEDVFEAGVQGRAAFLRGLFSADGSVQGDRKKGRSIRLTSTSKDLLRGVQYLLASMGIKSSIYDERRAAGQRPMPDGKGGTKLYHCKAVHELIITRKSMGVFAKRVGFSEGSPQKPKLEKILASGKRGLYADKLTASVVSVVDAGEEEVFDVLNTETTTFIANGIAISNCVEQTLWDRELCCLVETYPAHHDSVDDYRETLRVAYQYAKTVTLVPTHDQQTNAVMLRNRRIGCSMTGIVQAINKHGYREFFDWCDEGYDYIQYLDKKYSDWLCIPRSIKTTSVKPSGTVSLLAGSTPGVHWGHSPYYIRRVRVRSGHELVEKCRQAGYPVEEAHYEDDTMVIEFPIKVDNLERSKTDVSVREKVDLAAQMQYWWADNQVSCTAEFDPDEEGEEIPRILEAYEHRLKGISFLPTRDHGYVQAPYEEITQAEYEARIANLTPIDAELDHDLEDKFCSGEACKVDFD